MSIFCILCMYHLFNDYLPYNYHRYKLLYKTTELGPFRYEYHQQVLVKCYQLIGYHQPRSYSLLSRSYSLVILSTEEPMKGQATTARISGYTKVVNRNISCCV